MIVVIADSKDTKEERSGSAQVEVVLDFMGCTQLSSFTRPIWKTEPYQQCSRDHRRVIDGQLLIGKYCIHSRVPRPRPAGLCRRYTCTHVLNGSYAELPLCSDSISRYNSISMLPHAVAIATHFKDANPLGTLILIQKTYVDVTCMLYEYMQSNQFT